ncbi:MAG: HAD family hydrolase [Faecalibacterium sp.]
MQYKQWIFDMDGTLVDSTAPVWDRAPLVLLERFGRTPRPGLLEALLPLDLPSCAAYLVREYGLPQDPQLLEQAMKDVTLELYQRAGFKPGAETLLRRLKAEGVRMGLCSSTWEPHCRAVLARLGVADCFEFMITTQGANSKSRPDVFLDAMRRLGGDDPAGCVVCEDALYAARTARDAGFVVLGMQDEGSRADEPELRQICCQFVDDWGRLDWSKL